jgi:hypothetical protein
MSDNRQNIDGDQTLMCSLVRYTGKDGLFYVPVKNRPGPPSTRSPRRSASRSPKVRRLRELAVAKGNTLLQAGPRLLALVPRDGRRPGGGLGRRWVRLLQHDQRWGRQHGLLDAASRVDPPRTVQRFMRAKWYWYWVVSAAGSSLADPIVFEEAICETSAVKLSCNSCTSNIISIICANPASKTQKNACYFFRNFGKLV